MKGIWIPVVVVALAGTGFAQKRDQMVELQRDVALLQDKVTSIEKAHGEKLDNLEKLVQTVVDNQNKVVSAMTSLQTGLATQQKSLTSPVAAMGSKIDNMENEVSSLSASIAEINAALRKIQSQIDDMNSAVKTLQSPPPPPGSEGASAAGGPPPGMTPEGVFQSARKAQVSGQYDLALQQYQDYLKFFGQTNQAPDAQYYTGEILARQQKNEDAVKAFDAVLEQYPDGVRTLDAMYMKGVVLTRLDQKAAATAEFRALIKKSPTSEQAAKAADALKRLTAPAPAKSKKK